MNSQDKAFTKKIYNSPKVLIYGDLREITQAKTGAGTRQDNGGTGGCGTNSSGSTCKT